MDQIFEITLKSTNPDYAVTKLVVRTKGLDRARAIKLAEQLYGTGFKVYSILAGPRVED